LRASWIVSSLPARWLSLLTALAACLPAPSVQAHDPSAYGGLFRSRNFGGTWLNADVGLFLGGSVSVAVDPADGNHLLLGTDTALLSSRNAGRDWVREAPAKVFGAVFAVSFLPGGRSALAVAPGGVFRWDGADWQQAQAPGEAAPARAIALGAMQGSVYLLGRRALYRSEDDGKTWQAVKHNLPDQPEFTALAVAVQQQERLYAIVDGRVMMSTDAGLQWQLRASGLPDAPAEALTLDPAAPGRMWVAVGALLYRSDDAGTRWNAFGARLPEADTSVRGIAVDAQATTAVVTTHRGLFRSTDGAKTWGLVEGNLPIHLEARPLVRDPTEPNTLYAGFALLPYSEIWRVAVEGGNLLGRLDALSIAGGIAFVVLLIVLGALAAAWLARRRNRSDFPTHGSTR
jgi:photosystem II stability/assembly factor-like uncharacterized protein